MSGEGSSLCPFLARKNALKEPSLLIFILQKGRPHKNIKNTNKKRTASNTNAKIKTNTKD